MNKQTFIDFLDSQIKGKTLEEKAIIFDNILKWSSELVNNFETKYTYCEYCKKYSLSEHFKTTSKVTLKKMQLLQSASAYNLDSTSDTSKDIYGDVLYNEIYKICPYCKYTKKINKYFLKVVRRYDSSGEEIQ